MFRPFVEDDWRVTNNLTLNLGFAWALVTPITEAQGRKRISTSRLAQYLCWLGRRGLSGCTSCVRTGGSVGVQFDKTALEPRIGIAWKPCGRTKRRLVRGGYAIFHDSAWSQGAQGLWQNPPYYAEVDNFIISGSPCP